MSRKKASTTQQTIAAADKPWASKINQLRKAKGISRAALARELGVTPGAAFLWMKGITEPSAEKYLRLGNLAKDPEQKLWFWERAGLNRNEIAQLPWLRKKIAAAVVPESGMVSVPVLKNTRHVTEPALAQAEEIESLLNLPAQFVPNPAYTCGLRAPDGLALFAEGDVMVLDSTIEPEKLMAGRELVAVEDASGGLVVGWLEALPERRELRLALIITVPQKIITPVGQQIVLQPLVMASRQTGSAPFSKEPGSPHLLGRVIGLLRAPSG